MAAGGDEPTRLPGLGFDVKKKEIEVEIAQYLA